MMDIMGKRKYFFILSIVLILAGFIGLMVNGLNLDIQFQGGTLIQIQMNDENFEVSKAEAVASEVINKKITGQKLKTFNAEDKDKMIDILMLKVASQDALTGDELDKVIGAIRTEFNVESGEIQVQSVQPSIGKEMLGNGLKAAALATLLIVLYVWWRFSVMSGLSAAMMAILALLHDAAIMFAVYTVFNIPLNESFIAAVLTILGYSMNDTIIIYDRIRENSKLMRKATTQELVNTSVIQTLSRSINTTLSTLICIVTVYVFASMNNIQSLREFTLPLIVGLTSGAYSSIFIASPLWMMWKQHKAKKRVVSASTAQ